MRRRKLIREATDPFEAHFASPDEDALPRKLKTATEGKWQSKKLDSRNEWRRNMFFPEGEAAHLPAPAQTTKDLKVYDALCHLDIR